MKDHRICLVSCYFGKWPPYFPVFLKTCQYNPDINFYFFTDCERYDLPEIENVTFIGTTLAAVRELASEKLGFPVSLQNPYKLCDFKPAYGKIFEDHLSEFDFWGHLDIDIVLGDIRQFITDEILDGHDVISVRKEYLSGFFALYRNVESVKTLFAQSPDYQTVYQSEKHYCFDECNFAFLHLLRGKSIWEKATEITSMTHVIQSAVQAGQIKAHFETYVEEWITEDLHWTKGQLTEAGSGEALLLLHLIHATKSVHYVLPKWQSVPDAFTISKQGFFKTLAPDWRYRLERRRQQYIIASRRMRQKLLFTLAPVLDRRTAGRHRALEGRYCFGSFTVQVEQVSGQLHCSSDFFLTPVRLQRSWNRTFTSDLFDIIFRFRLRANGQGNLSFYKEGRTYSGYRL